MALLKYQRLVSPSLPAPPPVGATARRDRWCHHRRRAARGWIWWCGRLGSAPVITPVIVPEAAVSPDPKLHPGCAGGCG